jgi:ubiquinone biosynthesis monooxygenase Coq7
MFPSCERILLRVHPDAKVFWIMSAKQQAYHANAGRIMKVNHAGEHGAVSIYAGQILVARITARRLLAELQAFKEHEERHRAIFARELERRGLPRCRSYWLCAVGGFALGIFTALFGSQAISVTTVAVERVVLKHLRAQLGELANEDAEAVTAISSILIEEQQHHDQSAMHIHRESKLQNMLATFVSGATESVIWIGMRV